MKTIQCPFCQTSINIDEQASTVVCMNCCKSFSLGSPVKNNHPTVDNTVVNKPARPESVVVPSAPVIVKNKTATVKLPRIINDPKISEQTALPSIEPPAPPAENNPGKKFNKRAVMLLAGISVLTAAGTAGGIYCIKNNNHPQSESTKSESTKSAPDTPVSPKKETLLQGKSEQTTPEILPEQEKLRQSKIALENDKKRGVQFSADGKTLIKIPETFTEYKIPYSVKTIEAWAFSNCNKLSSINIPDSVTAIEQGAFSSCNNLTNINIPTSVKTIGPLAFSNCSKLSSINIPDSVTNIEDYAFIGCTELKSITLPDRFRGQEECLGISSTCNVTYSKTVKR